MFLELVPSKSKIASIDGDGFKYIIVIILLLLTPIASKMIQFYSFFSNVLETTNYSHDVCCLSGHSWPGDFFSRFQVTQQRAEQASCSILELIEQNVEELPPGGIAAWQEMLTYASSSFNYVCLGLSWHLHDRGPFDVKYFKYNQTHHGIILTMIKMIWPITRTTMDFLDFSWNREINHSNNWYTVLYIHVFSKLGNRKSKWFPQGLRGSCPSCWVCF